MVVCLYDHGDRHVPCILIGHNILCCGLHMCSTLQTCSTMFVNYPKFLLAVQSGGVELQAPALRLIVLLLVVYTYDDLQDTFKHLPGMPAHIPVQIHNANKALQLVDKGTVAVSCRHLAC